jgi:tripartite-type tricarboxylate transporter receptor subunit TctC
MLPSRRCLGVALAALLAPPAAAGRPDRATLLVPAPPGSGPDRWARGFAPFLERHWPRNTIGVTNLPGEGGLAAIRALLAAPPEERLILAVNTPLLLARAVERGEAGLLGRLAFLGAVTEEAVLLVAHPGAAESLAALRALGTRAILGTPPAGSGAHLAALALGRALPLDPLPFPSAPAARQAVLAGHIPYAVMVASEALGALREGRLSAIGSTGLQRSPLLPELPTLREQGLDVVLLVRRGFAAAATSSARMQEALRRALRAAVADPEFEAQGQALGVAPVFRDKPEWEPMLREELASLAARWPADPWTERRD